MADLIIYTDGGCYGPNLRINFPLPHGDWLSPPAWDKLGWSIIEALVSRRAQGICQEAG